ncbi:hypothetical protein HDU76_010270, partial [Blyttiomyces sp. JEL0837]
MIPLGAIATPAAPPGGQSQRDVDRNTSSDALSSSFEDDDDPDDPEGDGVNLRRIDSRTWKAE